MVRTFALGFLLSLVGPQPESFADRVITRYNQDRAYDRCMSQGGDDDWQCELVFERWPATRGAELK